jgi:eukaryotic-like serine/threonine-protein kinase
MSPSANAADRNLLFGILAVQMNFISKDALVNAMHAWVLDKQRLLGQILLDQKALATDTHQLLILQRYVGLHRQRSN